ncbi:MAG: phosphatidylserine decarboxylase [Holosporales bacterium]|jgi:phosphatidylserine decarboxylase|nr:phosphatidylserine decarboxylase [Holosporales bacterium]
MNITFGLSGLEMSFSGVNFTIHKEGFLFVGIGAVLSLIFATFSSVLAFIGIILTCFCAFFFRNPKRAVPLEQNLIVSPADGVVCGVNLETPPAEIGLGEEQRYKISIFLSIFDVHINRLPVSGKVRSITYYPGSFLNAALDKASVFNERNTVIVEMNGDSENVMAFTQIAGMVARRIVCNIHEGQEVNKGETFGLIRFGSRCDVWLPVGGIPLVFNGQKMVGGESVLCDVSIKKGSPREGVVI